MEKTLNPPFGTRGVPNQEWGDAGPGRVQPIAGAFRPAHKT